MRFIAKFLHQLFETLTTSRVTKSDLVTCPNEKPRGSTADVS
jgi:hypothetical protein